MSARSTWILRVATAAGCFALAVGSTSTAVASSSKSSSWKSSSGVTASTSLSADRFRNVETLSQLLAQTEAAGSPFNPGHGGTPPGRPEGRPVGGNPNPGTPPGQPDDRPPEHANNDKDK